MILSLSISFQPALWQVLKAVEPLAQPAVVQADSRQLEPLLAADIDMTAAVLLALLGLVHETAAHAFGLWLIADLAYLN